jgi:acetyltransferase-like isoleucine patch superfamily enzyme
VIVDKQHVALYGSGYLGKQIFHHIKTYYADEVEVIGFIDDTKPAHVKVIEKYTTLGGLDQAMQTPALKAGNIEIVFAIGYINMKARRKALNRVVLAGYSLFSVVHPRAVIEPGVKIGAGSVILGCAILDQQVSVGEACFIDIGVRLGAGTCVGSNNYFSSGTSTGSRVVIGDDCFFGMDCTVTTDVQLGNHLFVNAKTLVPRNMTNDIKLVELHKAKELPHTQ